MTPQTQHWLDAKRSTFDQAKFDSFLVGAQALADGGWDWAAADRRPVLSAMIGQKYIRIVSERGADGRSAFCFIDRSNGDVLKCEGWKRPARHARGNIHDAQNGLGGITQYGGRYL